MNEILTSCKVTVAATHRVSVLPETTAINVQGGSRLRLTPAAGFGVTDYRRYVHTQASPSTTWTIPHNFGKKPIIQVFTVGGVEVEAQPLHLTDNTSQVAFDAPFAGFALCLS